MALSVTHPFVSGFADGPDATQVRPSNWNAAHTLAGIATAAQGGTNSAFFQVAGPTVARTYTFPDANATIARTDAANTFTGVQTFSTPIDSGSVAAMTATVGGGVPTPPNNTTTFLRGDGTFAAPAGGGATLNGITAATGAVTIANANNTGIVWNWANTTDSTVAFTCGETSAATNGTSTSGVPNQAIFKLTTLAASTASPLTVYSRASHVFSVSPTTAQIIATNGSVSAPSYSFASGFGYGFYKTGNVVVTTANGTDYFQADASNDLTKVRALNSTQFLTGIGTSDSGFFWPSSGVVGLSIGPAVSDESVRWLRGASQLSFGSANSTAYALNVRKSRGTVASPTVITTGDDLATMTGYGYVGATNTYLPAAQILFDSTGTIADATSGIGGQVKISTTLAGTDTALQLGYTFQGGSNPITIRAAILFANLGTPANGAEAYCSDCDAPTLFNSTCTSSGAKTGAFAQRINGAWIC